MLRSSLSRGLAAQARNGGKLPAVNPVLARGQASAPGGAGSGGSGAGKVLMGAGVLSVGVASGTIGYASVSPDFRRQVETAVPGMPEVLNLVLGEPDDKPKAAPAPAPPSKLRPRPPTPEVTKTPEEPAVKPPVKQVSSGPPLPPLTPPPPPLATPPAPPLEKPPLVQDAEDSSKKAQKKEEKKAEAKTEEPAVNKLAAESDKKVEVKEEASQKKEEEKRPKEHKKQAAPPPSTPPPSSASQRDLKEELDFEKSRATLLEKSVHRRVAAIREELEQEMRVQLKRQSEAHSDHLADALDVQAKELERKHRRQTDGALEKTQLEHNEQLAGLLGHVNGLRAALEGRAHMDVQALEAQELWLACSALQSAVDAAGEAKVAPLARELAAVRRVLDAQPAGDAYVRAVLDAVPGEAARRGVYTETALRERFLRVERLARCTAMIGDEGGSLLKYLLSYVRSALVFSPSTADDGLPDKTAAEIDVDRLSVYDLVWMARASLDRGDLDQAVRYMSLLRGEPANVSGDWLKEARLHLELKQAARALMVHAAAVGVEALPQRDDKSQKKMAAVASS